MDGETIIDGNIGEGKCQVEGCSSTVIGTLMWRHLPGLPGAGGADFCGSHAEEIGKEAFISYWREYVRPPVTLSADQRA